LKRQALAASSSHEDAIMRPVTSLKEATLISAS
jgi:hypothetical protein